jgi:guanylate kinase
MPTAAAVHGEDASAPDRGRLFILSGPSGVGKSTLCRCLRRRFEDLHYSVSHTTRPPREGERDGVDYHFTTRRRFEEGIRQNQWAEWARVYDNYYGTSAGFIDSCLESGESVLLDIDVQGTRQILARYPECVTIFILPPSLEALESRLAGRATDAPEVIARRMQAARAEIAQRDLYRHVVVNDDLKTAAAELIRIFESYGLDGTSCRSKLKAES